MKKFGWSESVLEAIDWNVVEQAMCRKTLGERRGIVKMVYEWNATKTRQAYKDPTVELKCCDCEMDEDARHVYRCQHKRQINHRKTEWKTVKRSLRMVDTRIVHHMWLGLHSFERDHQPEVGPIVRVHENIIAEAFANQTEIGWYHMLMGRVSKKWAEANRHICNKEGVKMVQTNETWTSKVVESMWRYALSM